MICEEGMWFSFPLEKNIWGVGLVAHRDNNKRKQKAAFFGYFFVLEKDTPPLVEDTLALTPESALNAGVVTSMGFWRDKTWVNIGKEKNWPKTKERWVVPPLLFFDQLREVWLLDYLLDDLTSSSLEFTRTVLRHGDPTEGWSTGQMGHKGLERMLLRAYKVGLKRVSWLDTTSNLTDVQQAKEQWL